ncbi:hypothetical protein PMAYCL1PPCAC_09369 [Pristionchus mayeri]|uniref:Uncharacterized protein n=1 Tax=Pristionchus mayeri TaxID=1317129 RepID=A0AAN4ZFW3_9BILA|nr:hypothetical protein PMAYCL1PPCAC_09369 [Pristionchus mayeri]
MRYEFSLYARDSSHFLYITGSDRVFTLDTITMEFLPPLRTNNIELHSIAGVHDGFITADSTIDDELYLVTARLPKEYSETNVTVNGETITIDVFVEHYKDMETLLKDVLEGSGHHKERNNKEEELNLRISDLQKVVSDMINEKETIQRVDEARLTELKMSINQLEKKHAEQGQTIGSLTGEKTAMLKTISDLRKESQKSHQENHQIYQLREDYLEIQSKNDKLTQEKALLQQANDKMLKTNNELKRESKINRRNSSNSAA